MKKIILITICIYLTNLLSAQVSKTVNITAGGLAASLTTEDKNTITDLIINGTIDARDFKTMRDSMPVLAVLDLNGITILSYSGDQGTYVQENVDYPANEIPLFAFRNLNDGSMHGKKSLKSVIISASIISIGRSAFDNCRNLTKINIPESVISIGENAFLGCSNLTSFYIPSSIKSLGEPFLTGDNLQSIYSNCSVPPVISGWAIQQFDKTRVTLNVPFGTADRYATAAYWNNFIYIVEDSTGFNLSTSNKFFNYSGGNDSVYISSNVDWTIESNQEWIKVNPTSGHGNAMINITSEPNLNFILRNAKITVSSANDSYQTISILQSSATKTININNCGLSTVLTAEERATVSSITLLGTMCEKDFYFMRDSMPNLTDLDLSNAIITTNNVPAYAFSFKGNLRSVILPSSITSIGNYAFDHCSNLVSINFPPSLESIGGTAFWGCSLESVILPNSLTYIGPLAFFNCNDLRSITLSSSLTTISYAAFGTCSLTKVIIPDGIKYIEDAAFNWSCFETIELGKDVSSIGNYAFASGCYLKTLIVHNPEPIDVSSSYLVFPWLGDNKATLIVPCGSKEKYSSTPVWNTFKNILEVNLSETSVNFPSTESKKIINVVSNEPWTASSDLPWLRINPASGSGDSKMEIVADTNTIHQDRTAKVTVTLSQSGCSEDIIVTQKEYNSKPTLQLGEDQIFNVGDTIHIKYNGYDSDNDEVSGNFFVSENFAKEVRSLFNVTKTGFSFIAPDLNYDSEYQFVCWVSDGRINSVYDTINISVKHKNHAPVAFSYTIYNTTVNDNVDVYLRGEYSYDPNGDTITYAWSAPEGVTPNSSNLPNPTFHIPVISGKTQFIFTLVVNDGNLDSSPDTVIFNVSHRNLAPLANAGPDQIVSEGSIATLDGSASSDVENDGLTYKWTAPPEIVLNSNTIQKPIFTAPSVLRNTDYTFTLMVNDGEFDSPVDQVVITIQDIGQLQSIPQYVNEGATVTLDGSVFTATSSGQFTYKWTCPEGITLSSDTAKRPTFIAPNVTNTSKFSFLLVVTDGVVESSEYQVIVYVIKIEGAGTSVFPYLISSVAELNWMRVQVNNNNLNFGDKNYKLTNDLDFTNEGNWIPIGTSEAPFKGIFNGNDKVIRHIRIGSESNIVNNRYSGLFGSVQGGIVSNVGVEWDGIFATFNSNTYAGGIVASLSKGTIINCYTSGNINNSSSNSESSTGGIAGINTGSIINCYTTSNISSTPILKAISGGIAGENYVSTGTIKNCYAVGDITSFTKTESIDFKSIAGGIAGVNDRYASIKNCLALNKSILAINPGGISGTIAHRIAQNTATLYSNSASPLIEVFRGTSTTNLTKITEFTGDNNGITMTSEQEPVKLLNVYVNQNKTFNGIPLSNWKIDSTLNNGFPIFGLSQNELPVANAGLDQVVNERDLVILDGTLSSDPEDSTLTYLWTAPEGITLNSFSAKPIFTAPNISKDTDYIFILIVNDGISNSKADSVKITVLNRNEICQIVQFKTGWNIFSVPSTPNPAEMGLLFQPAISNKSLVKIQDEAGNSLENWGIFGGWQDNIGDILPTEGYKIKVSRTDSVEICGVPVDYPFAIPLNAGWNIMGYPQTKAISGMDVLQQLITRGTLLKAQDELGNSVENWGIFGGWQNNIGNFMPGKGFKIKVNAKDTLWIYESYPKSTTIQPELVATTHFRSAFEGNGVDHMNINIVGLPLNMLKAGDELAVFDNETCVGAVTIMPHHLKNQSVSIIASATDNQGMPGFTEGSQFTLKLWNSQNNKEFILEPEIVKGTSTFSKHETTIASLEKYATTGFEGIPDLSSSEINCYPNPFSDKITVEIKLASEAQVQVEVMNQLGQRVKMITTKQLFQKGLNKLEWNGRNANEQAVAHGVYILQLSMENNMFYKKIVYSR